MDIREINKNALITYLQKGVKQRSDFKIGLELEHFIVHKDTKKTVGYYEEKGIAFILNALKPYYDKAILSGNQIIGLIRKTCTISLEPAGQFEFAFLPEIKIKKMEQHYQTAYNEVTAILEPLGYELLHIGYHPKSLIEEMKIIPKKRYDYMDAYFKTTGNYGKDMMKGSGSTQISLDFQSEEDFSKSFRVANVLCPIFSLLTDNTPIFRGKPYEKHMARAVIWNDVDPDRSMIVKDALNKPFGFEAYADYILDAPAILVLDKNHNTHYTKDMPIKEIYKDTIMSSEEIEHVLTMFFPDVRLKTYLEIRMADSMPLPYVLSYISLLKGIFYCEKNRDTLFDRYDMVTNKDVTVGKKELIEKGYEGIIYGTSVKNIIRDLFTLAKKGLTKEEISFLQPLECLAKEETTLAKKYHENHGK